MSKPIFIHEDSEFAKIWKNFGTENISHLMNPFPFEKATETAFKRLFIPNHQPDVDEYGFYLSKCRDLGRKTVLSGMEYYNLMVHGRSITRAYTGLNNKINFESIDMNAYDAPKHRAYEIDELTQWVPPTWNYPKIKLDKFISQLIHTDKQFNEDYIKFKDWLKQRLVFKRMDRYDLSKNNFYLASRRYGITFVGQSFTTY